MSEANHARVVLVSSVPTRPTPCFYKCALETLEFFLSDFSIKVFSSTIDNSFLPIKRAFF